MNNLLYLLLNRRLSANILTFCILALGVLAVTKLPLAEKPIVELGKANIITSYPGASAEDIEANINSKLEKELLSVTSIKTFTSKAELGSSNISIELKPSVKDVKSAYQDVRDAINKVSDLPSGVTSKPTLNVKKSFNLDFMVLGIASDKPYNELRKKAKNLELGLRRIEGVGEVHLLDMRDLEHLIKIESEQLQRYGFTLNEVADSITKANILSTGGSLEGSESQADIVIMEELKTPKILAETILSKKPKIKLVDITEEIIAGSMKTSNYVSINGKKAIGFDLRTAEGADVIATATRVKEFLKKEQKSLGNEYTTQIGFDLSEEIDQKFSIIKNNGLVGLILVILSLAVLLNRKIALPVALSMPFCMFGTIAMLPLLGQILDSYTLAAILLIMGVIVDDAVVVSEKISTRYNAGENLEDATVNGLKEVLPSVFVSILTTMVAFLPLLAIPGNTGKMLYVMPLIVIIALVFSFIDVVFILPSHVKHALAKKEEEKNEYQEPTWIKKLQVVLLSVVKHKLKVLLGFIVTASILGYLSFTKLPYIFFPSSGAYLVEVVAEVDGTSNLDSAWKTTRKIEKMFAENKEIKKWYGEVGVPYSTWTLTLTSADSRILSADEIVAQMEEKFKNLEAILSVEFDVDTGGAPVGKPIEIQVVGGDDENRDNLANELTKWLKTQDGVTRVHKASAEIKPQIIANLNHRLLKENGVSVSDISRTLKLAIDGERVGRIFLDGEEVYLRIMLEKEDKDLENLLKLPIKTDTGVIKDLNNFVDWEKSSSPATIKHYNGQRTIKVTAGVTFGVTDPIRVETAMREYFTNLDYNGARLVTTGQAQSSKEAMNGLSIAMIIAIGAILCLLLLLFDNFWESLIALSIIPFGIVASLTALWIHSESLSFFAIVGTIGLVGIMVNNALVLISYYKQNLHKLDLNSASSQDITNFAVEGSISRARAVIITSVTTILGMIPLAYGLGGYDNFMGPIALVIGWGVFVSAICVLFFIPSLYAVTLEKRRKV